MAKKNEDKTNVMRLLDAKGVKYQGYNYVDSGVISGPDVARVLEKDPKKVFKTLVTVAASKKNYVFLLPVEEELDLKKAARAVGEKSIAMLPSKELLPLTGYVHGGCSPLGMKKQFVTVIDSSAEGCETIFFSGGKIGYQVEVSPSDISSILRFSYADIVASSEAP